MSTSQKIFRHNKNQRSQSDDDCIRDPTFGLSVEVDYWFRVAKKVVLETEEVQECDGRRQTQDP